MHDPIAMIFLSASTFALTTAILWLGTRVNNLAERVSKLEGIIFTMKGIQSGRSECE